MYKLIRISEETHARLKELGKKDESFDDIISRLIDSYTERG